MVSEDFMLFVTPPTKKF